jgi:hypothetical protein
MTTRYRILTATAGRLTVTELADRAALDAWLAARGFTVDGEKRQRGSIALAPEIDGQPLIGGLYGPMRDGPGVCRYEDRAANDHFST